MHDTCYVEKKHMKILAKVRTLFVRHCLVRLIASLTNESNLICVAVTLIGRRPFGGSLA